MDQQQARVICEIYDDVFRIATPSSITDGPTTALTRVQTAWSYYRREDLDSLDGLVDQDEPATAMHAAEGWKDHYLMRLFRLPGCGIRQYAYDSLKRRLERLIRVAA